MTGMAARIKPKPAVRIDDHLILIWALRGCFRMNKLRASYAGRALRVYDLIRPSANPARGALKDDLHNSRHASILLHIWRTSLGNTFSDSGRLFGRRRRGPFQQESPGTAE